MKKLFSSGIFLVVVLMVFVGMFAFSSVVSAFSPAGTLWIARTAAEANNWRSVTYGNGLFVAVANTGTHRVMTSPDGITWTARTAAVANEWSSVTYGGGLFVAVSDGFSDTNNNRVMTSPDGITWTARISAESTTWNGWPSEANRWVSVAYGNGVFVASSNNGNDRLMTSPNGINWTIRISPMQYYIQGDPGPSVAYGEGYSYPGVFHMVGRGSATYFSSDGITWTPKGTAGAWGENKVWRSLASNNIGTFVAVASSGDIRAMSTIQNISWNARTVPLVGWTSVTYGGGLFVAVSESSAVMTSPDGGTWTLRTGISNYWASVTYGNGTFVAVTGSGANRVMTSGPSVDGGWSAWSPASCPTACGQPASTQTRTCTNPAPSGGGADCSGSTTQSCSATPACASLPTLTTKTPVTNISQTTATGGGNISSNGGAVVTVSGLVWSTTLNPTYPGGGPGPGQTTNGWAIGGPWTSNMTGLTANTLYHVRAYATNSVGTAYGADVTFTTTVTPINGVLGDANGRTYPNGASSYSPYIQCSAGNSSNTTFPSVGVPVFWQCLGSGGGVDSGVGSASQAAPAAPVTIIAGKITIVEGDSTILTWNGNGPCTGTNFSTGAGNPPSGNVSVSPTSTTTYTVNCSNGSASVVVTVRKKPTFIEN